MRATGTLKLAALAVLLAACTPTPEPVSEPPAPLESRRALVRREGPRPATAAFVGTFAQDVARRVEGPPDRQVLALAFGPNGLLHAGTERGLFRLEESGWRAVAGLADEAPLELLARAHPESLVVAGPTALWAIGVDGVAPVASLPPEARLLVALTARGDRVAVATATEVWEPDQGRLRPLPPLPLRPEERVRSLAIGPGAELVVGTTAGLLRRLADGPWERLLPAEGARSWSPRDVVGLGFDGSGWLWFAAREGLGCREGGGDAWRLFDGEQGLPWNGFTALSTATDGVVWLGTDQGAIRFDSGPRWAYRQGRRWLPGDRVRALTVGGDGGAWFATDQGPGVIERRPTTLAEKARFFEAELERRHRRTRFGYVNTVRLPRPGDPSEWVQEDSDNDGLWTAMYGASQCFAFAATHDPAAKERARQAFEALRHLVLVTQGGSHPAPPGFPARSVLPASGPDPNARHGLERDRKKRAEQDALWKLMPLRWPRSQDGEWFWKCDTSSDELDGHFFFYAQYHDLVADEAERTRVREVVCAIVDHLLAHELRLVDWDGHPTRWANFSPASLNHDQDWWEERGLNSLSILSYLRVAERVSGVARYGLVARWLIEVHGYAQNALQPKAHLGPGTGNHSDDEMAFMSLYDLLLYEPDPALRARFGLAWSRYWRLEAGEQNPFFAFACAASLAEATVRTPWGEEPLAPEGPWLEQALETLRRFPLDRVAWAYRNSHRLDLVRFPGEPARGQRRDGSVIPIDERFVEHWNLDPWRLDGGGDGRELADGAAFLLPYWMGRWHGFIGPD